MAKLIDGTRVYGTLTVDTSIILAGNTVDSVTGTGTAIVRSISPTITGHPTIEGVTSTGATGTGKFVFDGSPTLVTPNLGNATATTINRVTITAPTTAATLTLANNSSLTTSGAFATTLTSTTATSVTLPASGYLVSTSAAVTGTPGSTTFLRGDSTWSTAVTNFTWTGGIVSVATSATTPALTIAGTSGGIVYFDSATSWASSSALAANYFVLGGGAGAAPRTTLTGTGVVNAIGTAANTTVTNSQTYASGGATSQNTVVLTAVTGIAIGQYVSGTGLAAGTYVTNISSNTVTVSNNFTVQAAGTYTFNGYGIVTQNSTLTANNILLGGGSGVGIASTATGTNVVAALGNQTNTTSGIVTQTAVLTASNLLLGGGSGTGISSTSTGLGVVYTLGNTVNSTTTAATTTAASGGAVSASTFVVTSAAGIAIGQYVSGTGLAANTYVTNVASTTVTVSNAFTVAASGTYTFYNKGIVTQAANLNANSILIGGGAGVGISSITTGSSVISALGVDIGSTGSLLVNGGTAGTPFSITLTNGTNLPISGIAGLGTGVAAALAANVTGSNGIVLATGPTVSLPVIDNIKLGWATTATAGGTTTLTSSSAAQQYFTGTSAQTIILPVTSTLAAGLSYLITNNSTGDLTVKSSGNYQILVQSPNTTVRYLVLDTASVLAAAWDYYYTGFEGSLVASGTLNHLAYYNASSNQVASATYAVFANSQSQLTLGDTAFNGGAGGNAGTITLIGDKSGSVALQAAQPTVGTANNWVLTLPVGAGSSGYVLSTDGSGVTSWVNSSGISTGGSGTTAAVTVSSSTPSSANVGDLWWNPSSSILSIYQSSTIGWIDASGRLQDWGYITGLIYSYDDYGSVL